MFQSLHKFTVFQISNQIDRKKSFSPVLRRHFHFSTLQKIATYHFGRPPLPGRAQINFERVFRCILCVISVNFSENRSKFENYFEKNHFQVWKRFESLL